MPAGVVTLIGPLLTADGTVATRFVLFVGGMKLAGAPLKLTALAPRRFWPVTVTVLPGGLLVGLKLVMLAGK